MSYQIPVLYTEQKTKKVKIWLDGYLVPRATLNSARLISAGKHEIDVVFYSSIDELRPGREFQTDRYLITIEESHNDSQPLPRPSYAVQDPTMKNRPKSAGFVPPRLVPRSEPPPPPAIPSLMNTYERQNPHQWGYAGTTPAMKRQTYDDRDEDNDNDHRYKQPPKVTKTSNFTPPAFQPRQQPPPRPSTPPRPPPPPVEYSKPSFTASKEQPGLLSDSLIQQLMGNHRPTPSVPVVTTKPVSPVRPSNLISWSNWDEPKSDDEADNPPAESLSLGSNPIQPTVNTNSKTMFNWQSLIQSTVPLKPIENQTKPTEAMPKFDFDDNSFDNLFEDVDDF